MARFRVLLVGCDEQLVLDIDGSLSDVAQDVSQQRVVLARLVGVDGHSCSKGIAVAVSKIVAVVEVDAAE